MMQAASALQQDVGSSNATHIRVGLKASEGRAWCCQRWGGSELEQGIARFNDITNILCRPACFLRPAFKYGLKVSPPYAEAQLQPATHPPTHWLAASQLVGLQSRRVFCRAG